MASQLLPLQFIYLATLCPSIIQSPRYATNYNIVGMPLNGYKKAVIIMTKDAAQALKKVQLAVEKDGFNLVVYDAYRPQTAVEHLKQWARQSDETTKPWYYPRLKTKNDLFTRNFIAAQSSHSRGSTVDVTLIVAGKQPHEPQERVVTLGDGTTLTLLDDGTIDMGTSFDFMDEASYTRSPLITPEQQAMRDYLINVMKDAGFKGCTHEWWHFRLENEPFPHTYFDFPIE